MKLLEYKLVKKLLGTLAQDGRLVTANSDIQVCVEGRKADFFVMVEKRNGCDLVQQAEKNVKNVILQIEITIGYFILTSEKYKTL